MDGRSRGCQPCESWAEVLVRQGSLLLPEPGAPASPSLSAPAPSEASIPAPDATGAASAHRQRGPLLHRWGAVLWRAAWSESKGFLPQPCPEPEAQTVRPVGNKGKKGAKGGKVGEDYKEEKRLSHWQHLYPFCMQGKALWEPAGLPFTQARQLLPLLPQPSNSATMHHMGFLPLHSQRVKGTPYAAIPCVISGFKSQRQH